MLYALLLSVAFGADAWEREGWGAAGLPAVNYNTDEGAGFGAIASLYKYDGETKPYKLQLNGLIFATTKGVQNHRLDFDALKLGPEGKLRLTGRVMYDATVTDNYCGLGGDNECDPQEARDQADQRGLTGQKREDFIRRYYKYRYIRPNANVNVRYRVGVPELLFSWRGNYYTPGTLNDPTPYVGSLYAQDFGSGEEGFVSSLQTGIMVDKRDNEPAPRKGYWVEGSVRGAAPYWGSQYDYFGFNTTLRGYVSLLPEGRLVWATRGMFDGMTGDVPVREMAFSGGFRPPLSFLGGLDAGRGIRQRRFIGRVKGLVQPELRQHLVHLEPAKVPLDIGWLLFVDVGMIAEDWDSVYRVHTGEGFGMRFAIDQNFIVRADFGFSAVEDYSPGFYLDINNLF